MTSGAVRVGVVGTTPYAETHMASITAHPLASLAAVAGRDPARTTAVAARQRIGSVFRGYEDMLTSGAVDAVIVVAPDELHEEIAVTALGLGIHVLCEKPLARTPEAARRMADVASRSGLVNMSYFGLRTSPHHRYLHQLVDHGAIGRVQSARFALTHGFFRSSAYNWRFDSSRGGGVVADLGCYLFDLARWYVGDVASVAAHGASHISRPHPEHLEYVPSADSCVGVLAFAGGGHASFEVSVVAQVGPGLQRNVVHLQGEGGRLELDHDFSHATVRAAWDDRTEFEELVLPADLRAPTGDAEFIDAIVAEQQVRPNFVDGWRVQQIVAAVETASQSARWVDLPVEDRR